MGLRDCFFVRCRAQSPNDAPLSNPLFHDIFNERREQALCKTAERCREVFAFDDAVSKARCKAALQICRQIRERRLHVRTPADCVEHHLVLPCLPLGVEALLICQLFGVALAGDGIFLRHDGRKVCQIFGVRCLFHLAFSFFDGSLMSK